MPAWFVRPAAGRIAERLDIYTDGYPARIHDALADVFPAVQHLVGPCAFRDLTERYVAAHRPTSYSLNDAGRALPRHLAADALGARLPFLADLATLEWQMAQAFHAHEEPPLDPQMLAGWTPAEWEAGVLRFQPAVRVVESAWPILDLRQTTGTPREQIDVPLEGRPQRVLVSRAALEVRCALIEEACALALALLLAGERLGAVMRELDGLGVGGDTVREWFAAWMRAGLIVGCR